MLFPESAVTRWVLAAVLAALIGYLVVRAIRKDRRQYQVFKEFEETADRQRMYRKWLVESFLIFGGLSAVILVLVWPYVPLLLAAVRDWPAGRWFAGVVSSSDLVAGLAVGAAVALVAGTIFAVFLARDSENVPTIGDIGALLPRNRAELGYGAALSINAGLVEELLFRLALPALVFAVVGNAAVAVVGSVLLFGGLHLYQGALGVAGSTLVGAVLMVLYLVTGSILVPIIAHALIDLRALVLIPVAVYRVQLKH